MLNSKNKLSDPVVLIIENVGQALQVQTSGQTGTVLEGVCAVFGEMNNNRRVYEKNEYLPHLGYLNEKITKKQLVGTLDHPQHFEPKLTEASHIIEKLNYDGDNRVFIKLRILENTPTGKIAKALIDGGVQLSISSRAAGTVNESGRVTLQRIFTYDLVGEPGFTEAILKQTVSESLKSEFQMITESYSHLKEVSFISAKNLVDVSESLNFADNFKVYKINNSNKELGSIFQSTPKTQKNSTTMADFVTREQMDQYSEVLKNQFSGIKKELSAHKVVLESADSGTRELKLAGFVNYLAEQLEGVINYADYISNKLNESIKYTEHVAETSNNSIEYTNYVGEKLNQSINHQDYMTEKLNQSINYAEYIKENLNNSLKYQNYLAEELDKGLQYTEYVANGSNKGIEYAEHLAENINLNREYQQYVAEKLSQTIGYTEYLAESLNDGGTATQKRNVLGSVSKINESTTVDSLVSKIDKVITEVNDKSAKAVLEGKYPFLKVITEAKRKAFYALDSETKHSIVETINASVWFSEADVVNIMEAVITHTNAKVPVYIKFMPAEYKQAFESMTVNEKAKVAAKSDLYNIKTPYQAKYFWDDLDLRGMNERIEIAKNNTKIKAQLNESQSTEGLVPVNQVVEMQRGYSQGYIEMIQRQADYRK